MFGKGVGGGATYITKNVWCIYISLGVVYQSYLSVALTLIFGDERHNTSHVFSMCTSVPVFSCCVLWCVCGCGSSSSYKVISWFDWASIYVEHCTIYRHFYAILELATAGLRMLNEVRCVMCLIGKVGRWVCAACLSASAGRLESRSRSETGKGSHTLWWCLFLAYGALTSRPPPRTDGWGSTGCCWRRGGRQGVGRTNAAGVNVNDADWGFVRSAAFLLPTATAPRVGPSYPRRAGWSAGCCVCATVRGLLFVVVADCRCLFVRMRACAHLLTICGTTRRADCVQIAFASRLQYRSRSVESRTGYLVDKSTPRQRIFKKSRNYDTLFVH